ncbi:hypothetical protein GS429_10655 [Natronorubrum sp. JWXQ-INN-674]|uniref:DUF8152 domain-containing protein n=1 Tax=Natronorubrum halalkaliphilum TaxID=2691917 RepID=A0A6B0VMS6_9EURY|nr:hypothetical protein [Natronorubrum halalkaliphilum]MXV62513.1 hypothetical protein [Natronorubrum halalkaliphilum]
MTDSSNGGRPDDADDELRERTRELHRHLEATAELPIDRETNRWLGEAEAIAADVATASLDEATVLERVEKVRGLLSEVDETGHEAADDHLETAKRLCTTILEDGDSAGA